MTVVEQIEAAFREGYSEGYSNGSSDAAAYEFGSGSKHRNTLNADKDEAWNSSDAKAELNGKVEAQKPAQPL
jgi:hypothetical protein